MSNAPSGSATEALGSWAPPALWAGLIFYLSSIPSLNSGLGAWDFLFRKMAHIVEYAVLTALLFRACRRTWPERDSGPVLGWCALVSVLYAMSDEWHQSFVPGRGPSVKDVLIDSIGIALVFLWMQRGRRRIRRND